jgi:aspartate/glutamate racemase
MPFKYHPRVFVVGKATAELGSILLDLAKKHELTSAEVALICSQCAQPFIDQIIRNERHPAEPEKSSGEA